jgi:hypothetical protein
MEAGYRTTAHGMDKRRMLQRWWAVQVTQCNRNKQLNIIRLTAEQKNKSQ